MSKFPPSESAANADGLHLQGDVQLWEAVRAGKEQIVPGAALPPDAAEWWD